MSSGLVASSGATMSPGIIVAPSLVASSSPVMSTGPVVSLGSIVSPDLEYPNPGYTANDQPPILNHDFMDVDHVPTVTVLPSDNPPYVPNLATETVLSPPLDPDLITNEFGTDLNTDGSSLPDSNPPSLNTPQQPNSPTTQTKFSLVFTQPPAAVVVKVTLDIKGVYGRFINKAVVRYWKDVPGSEKWISMLQSYINLEWMPQTNTICDLVVCFGWRK